MDPIVFLDFDGVLNTTSHCDLMGRDSLSHKMIDSLNLIIDSIGAKIVVSSDWRDGMSVAELQSHLNKFGCRGKVIGKTMSISDIIGCNNDHPLARLWMDTRPNQIKAWIKDHYINNYVVIDDMNLSGYIPNFVHVDHKVGLTDFDANLAISYLKRKLK